MIDPRSGPFLFDSSAHHQIHISAVTVMERIRGYGLLWRRADAARENIDAARIFYLRNLGHVWSIESSVAIVSGEIMAQLPDPPTTPRRSHRLTESRQDRLARWRFDGAIAAAISQYWPPGADSLRVSALA
jgi:hypothetical protein